ncbi:hypothetical protein MMC34_006052 [Xylographa carneopallida]|nr:hypothetical protein [Xylographa carneopallida]
MAKLRDKAELRSAEKRRAGANNSQNNDQSWDELQQSLLNVFKCGLAERFNASLAPLIQIVKGHLFNREFSKAFGSEQLLEAYAARWSPCRALAYMDLIRGLPQLASLLSGARLNDTTSDKLRVSSLHTSNWVCEGVTCGDTVAIPATSTEEDNTPEVRVVTCLGGGAGAEVVALAGCWRFLGALNSDGVAPAEHKEPATRGSMMLTVRVMDMADWANVVEKVYQGITTVPSVAKYSSSNTTLPTAPILESEYFKVAFVQRDILNPEVQSLSVALQNSSLVTLTFTLNELYSTSMSKTTRFLLTLTYVMEPGTLLLVVDSPGSYSTVKLSGAAIGDMTGAEKKYPMKWLLDHTLLETSSLEGTKSTHKKPQWEKLASNDSTWFRLQDGLKYPLVLEDMRYQYHLYKRI